MKKLLSSPAKMALSDVENSHYQKSLIHISNLSLNLMAVKVKNHPKDFLGWCIELLEICNHGINRDLLNDEQFKPLEKLILVLEFGVSTSQLKMARIAPWQMFVGFIEQQTELHALEERLALLDYIHELGQITFSDMTELDRLAFSGKHTSKHKHTVYNFDSEWFASTKGAKIFHTLLTEQPNAFDHALSYIPFSGDITPAEYQEFVIAYKKIFSSYTKYKVDGEKAPLAPASRLLAMRRPDQFIALTNTKIDILCQGLGIVKFNQYDFDSYWQDLIGTMRTFVWWHQPMPENGYELKIWRNRAILVDLFLFADKNLALGSNYLRLRDKTLYKHDNTSKPKKRTLTKLTAEELVDIALSVDDLPGYVKEKRDTIIGEVKKGKSPEHVIGLMRAIFG